MIQFFLEGLLLGISTGTICLATCMPIYLPYLLSENRKVGTSFFTVLQISAGRFFAYLAFGAIAGLLGMAISELNRTLFTAIAYILLAAFLLLSTFRIRKKNKQCPLPKYVKFTQNAFLLGILTGINFCPSFLIALSRSASLGGIFSGMAVFAGFFSGTTLFLLPLGFAGLFSKIQEMKIIGQIASILIAVWFGISGIWSLARIIHEKIPTIYIG